MMQLCPPGVRPRLEDWEQHPIDPISAGPPSSNAYFDRHERIVAVEPPGPPVPGGPFERAARAVMAYETFPERVGAGVVRRRPVQLGDSVGLLYRFFPGLRLFFASRVVSIIDQDGPVYRRGFLYQTILGHPEIGAETFCAEKVAATGEVRVYLEAWSRPAWWAWPVLPLARVLQLAAGRAALDNLERIARNR